MFFRLLTAILVLVMSSSTHSAIRFSKNIPEYQRSLLKSNIEFLQHMPFSKAADQKTLDILGIDDLNNESVYSWLTERVRYIFSEKEHIQQYGTRVDVQYPKSPLPAIDGYEFPQKAEKEESSGKDMTVMSNLGVSIYADGKSQDMLLGIGFHEEYQDEEEVLLVTSPRLGLLQIGEALFMRKAPLRKDGYESFVNDIYVLGVFFHEARHSDGNGKHLGFYHATCPKGHELEGIQACDRNLNGSYSVGAQMIKEMAKNCHEKICSSEEQEVLKLLYLNEQSRVLVDIPSQESLSKTPTFFKKYLDFESFFTWDATPEKVERY